MNLFFTILLIVSSLILIVSVLMQSGKSAGLSGSIGGGAEQLFGKQKGKGYDKIFDRVTKIAAIIFMLSALILVALQ